MREMPGREMSSTLSVITLSQDKTQKGGKDGQYAPLASSESGCKALYIIIAVCHA